MKNHIIKILLLFLTTSICLAQTEDSIKSAANLSDSGFVMQKSATGAMLRSAVLPGWGQLYNEAYWKIPIIWGVSAWFVYLWKDRDDNYQYYKDLYNKSLLESSNGNTNYKNARNFFRDDRDLYAIYIGLTYFLNLIDAYVDAHLFDFDVGVNNYTNRPELKLKINL